MVESEWPSKALLVFTFSLETGDSTPAAAAAQVVEVEPSEYLAKPGPLNYLVDVDPLEDLTTSTDYRSEHKNDTVRLCAIFDTCKEYPTDHHLFCHTPVTPDLVHDLFGLGPCCCLPTPMTLASGGSPMFPLVVHQPASPSIWPAVQSLRRGLSTNPGATMWCVCGCS